MVPKSHWRLSKLQERPVCNWNREHVNATVLPLVCFFWVHMECIVTANLRMCSAGAGGFQVYEDDLERNYNLMRELLIYMRTFICDGLPPLKDFEVCFMFVGLCAQLSNSLFLNVDSVHQTILFNVQFRSWICKCYRLGSFWAHWSAIGTRTSTRSVVGRSTSKHFECNILCSEYVLVHVVHHARI